MAFSRKKSRSLLFLPFSRSKSKLKRRNSVQELPYGWEKVEDPHYGVYYIDHVNRRTQYENPVHTAKKTSDDVTNTFPRQRKPNDPASPGVTKRSVSDHNMNGQVYGRPYFTKNPQDLRGEITKTSLVKSVRGLGFTIVGGNLRDTQFLQIKNVVENGPAYLSGKLKTGDVIVHVNNTCVLGFTHQDVVRLFQSIAPGETVELETCRGYPLNFDPDDPNTEIVTTVAVTLPQLSPHPHPVPPSYTSGNHLGGLKSLPDLTRGAALNSTSSLSPNASQEEGSCGMGGMGDGTAIPDLVSLSINNGGPNIPRPEILTIGIVKGPMGFGFTIADSPYGQRVKQILDQGRCKTLAEGDLLVQINSVNMRMLNHAQTVGVLKDCPQGKETVVIVQRGGIPPPSKNHKKQLKVSRSFNEQDSNGSQAPGSYFFNNDQSSDIEESFASGGGANNDDVINTSNTGVQDHSGNLSTNIMTSSVPEEQEGEGQDDPDELDSRTKAMLDKGRPKTPSDSSRPKTPTRAYNAQQQPYMEMSAPSRPDYFPRYDTRRDFARTNPSDDRWSNNRDAKPGQFRSRTPGPEMMTRGGPDTNSRLESHRPKTPTAADMRTLNGKPPGILSQQSGTSDPRSGRFTPNPSSEIGRQYRPPDYPTRGPNGSANHWPEFSNQSGRRYDVFDNPSLNRSYAGEFPRHQNSRPIRQSTSFESENPAPSQMTRLPRQGQGSPRGQDEGEVMETQVTLHRQESGYGFRIIGGTEEGSQVSVGHIVPGGAADLDGRLRQFDEITHVDGCSVLHATHHRVVQLMTSAAINGRVTLTIRRVVEPDIAPSQSSLSQYPMEVVVSRRENEGFGFVIISSVNKSGASVDEYIGHIQDNSPASRCGRLHVGDRLLAVNGVDTSGLHHRDVVGLIKDSGFSVALTIGPPPDDASSNASQRSSQGSTGPSLGHSTGSYPGGPQDVSGNIVSWERSHPPRAPSHQGSDDSGEIYQVELHRGSQGFGFSIRGGREFNSMPLFVLRIAEGRAADLDGRLRVGDQILEVNDFVTDGMTHTEAIEIIQSGGASVRLLMRRTNKPPPIFEGPPSSSPSSQGGLFPPAPQHNGGPISHSSPHMSRRQVPGLPPPPPELQNEEYYNTYLQPQQPPTSAAANYSQGMRFNNY